MATKAEEVFKHELGQIKDQGIKEFVIAGLNEVAPDYFWTCAASSSGKYHPKWDLGEGGTVRHTKMVAWFGREFGRSIPLSREEVMSSGLGEGLYLDCITAACVLHDIEKFGREYDGTTKSLPKDNTQMHGIRAAKSLYEALIQEKHGRNVPMKFRCILRGVAAHMGVWTSQMNSRAYWPDYQKDPAIRKVCQCVHYGDYAASRRPSAYIEELMSHDIG